MLAPAHSFPTVTSTFGLVSCGRSSLAPSLMGLRLLLSPEETDPERSSDQLRIAQLGDRARLEHRTPCHLSPSLNLCVSKAMGPLCPPAQLVSQESAAADVGLGPGGAEQTQKRWAMEAKVPQTGGTCQQGEQHSAPSNMENSCFARSRRLAGIFCLRCHCCCCRTAHV